jgi:hypothetical protein
MLGSGVIAFTRGERPDALSNPSARREIKMASFDKQRFVSFLRENVSPAQFGEGKCALHVRLALAAAGLVPATHPVSAKDWGATLETLGFAPVLGDPANAVLGDIAVIQTTSESRDGHIEGFDGTEWISDFVQKRGFWPGPSFRAEQPAFVLYRWPG